jgi:hypothetical protein
VFHYRRNIYVTYLLTQCPYTHVILTLIITQ